MGQFADVQRFVREANRVAAISDLEALLEDAAEMLGFDYFALMHHVTRTQAGAELIRIVDYPKLWQEVVAVRGYFSDDPVFAASEKSVAAFEWSSLPRIINMTPRQCEIIRAAREAGIVDGFVIPVHIPGEYAGSCCFSVGPGRDLPVEYFPAAQYIGCFAFEAARRITRKPTKASAREDMDSVRALTQRQLDCLLLVARGKSDWDIGRLLGISDQTVHKHIEETKRRYGVSTRMQLVTRALFNGHLTFGDVLN